MLVDGFDYEIFADYHQFILQDENAELDISQTLWGATAVDDLLFVTPGMIHIGTVRDADVPVRVELHDSEPEDSYDAWDHVTDASLDLPSGQLVIRGCTDYFPEAERIILRPNCYQTRIYYGNLDSLSFDGLEGQDNYRVVLWPGHTVESQVLKRWTTTSK